MSEKIVMNVIIIKNTKKKSISSVFTIGDVILYSYTTKHFDLQAFINTVALVLEQHVEKYNITHIVLKNAIE